MKLMRFGTDYGGFTIDIDRVPEDAVIIDAGVGTDMSFSEGLQKVVKGFRSVLVDHTEESRKFVNETRNYPWTTFYNCAIAKQGSGPRMLMYRHRTNSGSESFSVGHSFVNKNESYYVPTISLTDLIERHKPCIVKLDIESMEYEVIRECIGVDQVCAEFHHRMDSRYKEEDTDNVLRDFIKAGYAIAHRTATDEILMVKK